MVIILMVFHSAAFDFGGCGGDDCGEGDDRLEDDDAEDSRLAVEDARLAMDESILADVEADDFNPRSSSMIVSTFMPSRIWSVKVGSSAMTA